MEAVGQPMQPHLDAVLKKQPEPQNTDISLEEFNVWKEKEATGIHLHLSMKVGLMQASRAKCSTGR